MARGITRLRHHVGRRGAALLFLTVLDTLFGYSLLVTPLPAKGALDLFIPYAAWASLWLFTAGVCLIQAFMRVDKFAFSLAVALMTAWGSALGAAWLLHPALLPRGWVSVVIYWAFAGFIGVIAGWPEYGGGTWIRQ